MFLERTERISAPGSPPLAEKTETISGLPKNRRLYLSRTYDPMRPLKPTNNFLFLPLDRSNKKEGNHHALLT